MKPVTPLKTQPSHMPVSGPEVGRLQQLYRASRSRQQGKIGWILLWLVGVPVPILLVLFLLRGCT